jgi:hypothetical protein
MTMSYDDDIIDDGCLVMLRSFPTCTSHLLCTLFFGLVFLYVDAGMTASFVLQLPCMHNK